MIEMYKITSVPIGPMDQIFIGLHSLEGLLGPWELFGTFAVFGVLKGLQSSKRSQQS